MTTLEVYKQIWLLLVVKDDVVIRVDDPELIKAREKEAAKEE